MCIKVLNFWTQLWDISEKARTIPLVKMCIWTEMTHSPSQKFLMKADNKYCEVIIKVGNHLISKTILRAWIIKHVLRKLFYIKKIIILKQ